MAHRLIEMNESGHLYLNIYTYIYICMCVAGAITWRILQENCAVAEYLYHIVHIYIYEHVFIAGAVM